ncbi:MAG: tetratricopeptide repeat protein [Tepidisphaeraceae bacterium]|jgi:protein O-GlcNAc transferase
MPNSLTPSDLDVAVGHHRQGRLEEAKAIYQRIVAQTPDHAEALNMLGVVNFQLGQGELALELIEKSIALAPSSADYYVNLGYVLIFRGELERAIEAYGKALALKPGSFEAHYSLGLTLFRSGKVEPAIAEYRLALTLRPGDFAALHNLGIALRQLGRLDESVTVLKQALAVRPDDYDGLNNLAIALQNLGRYDESVAALRGAIRQRCDQADAHNILGNTLCFMGKVDEAIASFQKAIELRPETPAFHNNLANAQKEAGDLDRSIESYGRAVALDPNNAAIHGNWVYTLHFHPDWDPAALFEQLRGWNERHAAPLAKEIVPHSNPPLPERRLRIGYVSPDFRSHPVGRFLLPLIQHHDRDRFEIVCYCDVMKADEITADLARGAHLWRNIVGIGDGQVAQIIRGDQIDILIDLSMHMSGNRLLVFARKPAPVQITYLAYCSTTGMDAMDYRITDRHFDPDPNPPYYSERSLYLAKSYWCFSPIDAGEAGPLPAVGAGHVTFGCMNNYCKVSARAMETWMGILDAVPNSRLLLHSPEGGHRDRVRERLDGHGIDPARLEFVGRMPFAKYVEQYHRIDVALDPFPYCGGTTTCDGLWMGVPAVTLHGKTAVGRGGVSILRNLGLPQLIAANEGQYVQMAADLAADLPGLAELRASLRGRMRESALMDPGRFARDMESVYHEAWKNWCGR